MAISTTQVNNTNTTIYTSSGSSAVTLITICNYSASAITVDMHIVPNGGTASNANIMLKELTIAAKDTYIVYQGGEKIVLGNGDMVSVIASAGSSANAITSYVSI